MTCEEFERLLDRRDLSAEERRNMAEHVRACPACAVLSELRRLPEDEAVPDAVTSRWRQAVHEEADRKKAPSLLPRLAPVLAAAAVLVLAIALKQDKIESVATVTSPPVVTATAAAAVPNGTAMPTRLPVASDEGVAAKSLYSMQAADEPALSVPAAFSQPPAAEEARDSLALDSAGFIPDMDIPPLEDSAAYELPDDAAAEEEMLADDDSPAAGDVLYADDAAPVCLICRDPDAARRSLISLLKEAGAETKAEEDALTAALPEGLEERLLDWARENGIDPDSLPACDGLPRLITFKKEQ